MTRHLAKLVWARKRANLLLVVEIFVSFLVLFAVSVGALVFLHRLRLPMGFDWQNVYTATIDWREFGENLVAERQAERTLRVVEELRTLPEVVNVAAMTMVPFELAYETTELEYGGRKVEGGTTAGTDELAHLFGIEVVRGRWFEEADDALDWIPVVINGRMVSELFGDEDPIGKAVNDDPQMRVVGVIDDFRKNGALSRPAPFFFSRASLHRESAGLPRRILIRVAPGTGAAFEERVLATMRRLEPEWTWQIERTDSIRERNFKIAFAPLVVGALVAGFLLLMVFLGMVGVFWQAVTQRTGEVGLRRAMGAPRAAVYRQILAEIVIVTSIGSSLAIVLLIQLPLLGVLGNIGWPTLLGALALSLSAMWSLAVASGLYPAWLAARVEPADALHDE